MAEQLPRTEQQSIGQLIRRTINGVSGLVDRQIEIAKQEAMENVWEALGAAKTLAIGAGIALVGALILLNVVVLALILSLNWLWQWLGWIVILLILVVLFFVAYRVVMRGLKELQIKPIARTRRTLREDVRWARQLLTRNAK